MAGPEATSPSLVVRDGDTVIWDVNGDRQAFITLDPKCTVKLGKVFCSAAPLLGCPYGAMFALSADNKSLERTPYVPLSDWELPDGPDFNTRSNADLMQNDGNQSLSAADIEAMKAEGAAGADIVAALTANSATFAAKTEFSQEKYKKKKAKKYIQVATVRRPTAATVCEAYFANSPAKSTYLRVDTLALLLSLANVGAHARVLVVESCGGLVTAAALERLGGAGLGCIASAWAGGQGTRKPSLEIWRHFNFPPAQQAKLRFAPLHELLAERCQATAAQQATSQQPGEEQQQALDQRSEQQQQAAKQQLGAQHQGAPSEVACGPVQTAAMQMGAPAPLAQEQPLPAAVAVSGGAEVDARAAAPAAPFNCCILAATNLSPLALVRHVLPLLTLSASLAVYCPWQHPLAEAMDALRGQGQVAGLALHESWWREMQVLPLRSHPTMNMNHGGGFILSGTVLAPQQA